MSLATRDVRRFLSGLLSDPRVVELPRALWLPILYGLILPSRPYVSARKYARIWTPAGLADDRDIQRVTERALRGARATHARALLGGARHALQRSRRWRPRSRGYATRARSRSSSCRCSRSIAARARARSTIRSMRSCAAGAGFRSCASLPSIMTIRATSRRCARVWCSTGKHTGAPRHCSSPFTAFRSATSSAAIRIFCKCQKTARLLAEELMLRDDQWSVSFQSRFGAARWLAPYTADVVAAMPARRHRGTDGRLSRVCDRLPGDAGGDRDREPRALSRRRRPTLPLCTRRSTPAPSMPGPCGSHRAALPGLDAVRTRSASPPARRATLRRKTQQACSAAFTRSASAPPTSARRSNSTSASASLTRHTADTWPHPYGVLTDGRTLPRAAPSPQFDSPALTFVHADVARYARELAVAGSEACVPAHGRA